MGSYATINGTQVKFCGLIAEVLTAAGCGRDDSGIAVVSQIEAAEILSAIDCLFELGMSLSRQDGTITMARCDEVADLAKFAGQLVDWLSTSHEQSKIMFV